MGQLQESTRPEPAMSDVSGSRYPYAWADPTPEYLEIELAMGEDVFDMADRFQTTSLEPCHVAKDGTDAILAFFAGANLSSR